MKRIIGRLVLLAVLIVIRCASPAQGENVLLYPHKAVIVLSKETWGCPVEQRIIEDVTSRIAGEGGTPVRIEATDVFDDLIIKKELYLYFPAQKINGLSGYFIIKLLPERTGKAGGAYLSLGAASLSGDKGGYLIRLKMKWSGSVKTTLLYGRQDNPQQTFIVCPGAGPSRPGKIMSLRTHEFKVSPKAESKLRDDGWNETVIPIAVYFQNEAALIDRSEQVLDHFDSEFSVPGYAGFLWDESELRPDLVREALAAAEKSTGSTYKVSIVKYQRNKPVEVWSNEKGFVPKLRQKIVVQGKGGRAEGGEILISPR
jgi:hypothetical protein